MKTIYKNFTNFNRPTKLYYAFQTLQESYPNSEYHHKLEPFPYVEVNILKWFWAENVKNPISFLGKRVPFNYFSHAFLIQKDSPNHNNLSCVGCTCNEYYSITRCKKNKSVLTKAHSITLFPSPTEKNPAHERGPKLGLHPIKFCLSCIFSRNCPDFWFTDSNFLKVCCLISGVYVFFVLSSIL